MDETTTLLLRLLNEYGARLHTVLLRVTLRHDAAEELMQELFLRLQGSEAFGRSSEPERYIFRAAMNLAFDWRRKNHRPETESPIFDQDAVEPRDPIERLIRREELELVLSALQSLSEEDREVITSKYIEGAAHELLATRMGRTAHHVRSLCSKAIARLRREVRRISAEHPESEVPSAGKP